LEFCPIGHATRLQTLNFGMLLQVAKTGPRSMLASWLATGDTSSP